MPFANGQGLTAEEAAVLKRAQSGLRRSAPTAGRGGGSSYRDEQIVSSSKYPAAAEPKTLELLGTLDALLKAPPQPPRWALLQVLSVLEQNAAQQ